MKKITITKYIITITLLIVSLNSFSQDHDSLKVLIEREVIKEKYSPPIVRSYFLVKDSIDFFIENFQEAYGQVEDENGKYSWNKVNFDTLLNNINIVMLNGVVSEKNGDFTFLQCSPEKSKYLKENETRVLKISFSSQKNKDILLNKNSERILMGIINEILNKPLVDSDNRTLEDSN